MLNPNKFSFIICTNNEIYLQECIHYINHLVVPDGYSYDILTIRDAPCMTAGYNEGMNASDSKYKIYMHQDVFILNQNFLSDILSIFQSDSAIGMIGMVGYPSVAPTAIMWTGKRFGATYLYGVHHAYPNADYTTYQYKSSDGYSDVALIDGLMMITSYDFPWNEEDLTAWHFYDAFHSMNFLLSGYRIVVPNQSLPWCLHDDGKFLNMYGYGKFRRIFIKKYGKYLGKAFDEIRADAPKPSR